MNRIKNRSAYPATFKRACVEGFRTTTLSAEKFAEERNISGATMRLWAANAGISTRKAKVVRTANATEPVVQPSGEITYQGKIYTAR